MRRVLGGLLVVVLSLAAVIGLVLVLQSRDDAQVGSAGGPGAKVAERCPAHPASVTRDRRRLSAAQIQTALAQGNIVILYPVRPLAELRQTLGRGGIEGHDQGGAEVAAAGQQVILAESGASAGYEARAWGRRLAVETPQDPRLREFADAWLGRGAPDPCT